MCTFTKTLAVGLLVLNATACSVGGVTASTRLAESAGGGTGPVGANVEPTSPNGAVERTPVERPVIDRSDTGARNAPAFRIESDCWRCR